MKSKLARSLKIAIIIFIVGILFSCSNNESAINYPAEITFRDELIYFIGEDYPDFNKGVEVNHSYYENAIQYLIYESDNVKWNQEGKYEVSYYVNLPSGLITKKDRLLIVIEGRASTDDQNPYIVSKEEINYYIGDNLDTVFEDIVVYDKKDGFITEELIIEDYEVDYNAEGNYTLILQITDSDGNQSFKSVVLNVIEPFLLENEELSIIYLNDLHGAILEDQDRMGLSKISSYIDYVYENEKNVIFISGGDMLQGSILSNYFFGATIIEVLNIMKHDAFTIGNHEFDWGLDSVLSYFNGENEIQAEYPFLGANVFYRNSDEQPNGISPYTVLTRGNLKIGVIGTIGFGLESSIANSRVEGYEFKDPVYYVSKYAKILRESEGCHIIIAIDHAYDNATNNGIAKLDGSSKVDFMFNGHSHQNVITSIRREGSDLPVLQSSAYGKLIGHIKVNISREGKIDFQVRNLDIFDIPKDLKVNTLVDSKIEEYYLQISNLIEEIILPSSRAYSRDQLTQYISKLMAIKTDSVIGIHNRGGTRSDLDYNEGITVAKIYEIFPFDNRIKTVMLKGNEIKTLINTFSNNEVYINFDQDILDDQYYRVATNDYLFDKDYYSFKNGTNIIDTGIYIRDLLEAEIREQSALYSSFSMNHEIIIFYYEESKKKDTIFR